MSSTSALARALIALAVALLMTACVEPWVPDSFPADVVVVSDTTPEQREAIKRAADEWNTAVGAGVFRLRFAPGGTRRCGRINLYVTASVPDDAAAITDWDRCSSRIRVHPEGTRFRVSTMHELGHALGLDHSADEDSAMHAPSRPWGSITDEDVAAVRAVMGL